MTAALTQVELEVLKVLAGAMAGAAAKTSYKASPATATLGHGAGGLFSGLGRERPVFSAMALPAQGIQSILPVRKSNTTNPLFDLLTGVTASSGSEPADTCGTFPRAGKASLCTHSFVFGLQGRSTQVYDLAKMGEVVNRGEFLDQQLIGNPLNFNGVGANVPTGTLSPDSANNIARSESAKAMFEFGVAWARDFAKEMYTGTPSSNIGGRKYFWGFDALINSGYQDAETGAACPAADSTIASFGNNRIEDNAGFFVKLVSRVYVRLVYLASQVGLAPAKWVISMTWAMFYEATEVWPCAYQSYRCQVGNGNDNNEAYVDGFKLSEMRDLMRGDMNTKTGQYLIIDGQPVPVVIDDAITETIVANGVRQSQLYFIPMTVMGGTPVTYMDYFDFSAPNAGYAFAQEMGFTNFKTSDDGRFFWVAPPSTGYCIDAQAITRPRLMVLTPHIAGRITNIRYAPLLANRSGFPDDTNYFVAGGKTDRVGLGGYLYPPVPGI